MNLWKRIAELLQRDAKKMMYVPIPTDHTNAKYDESALEARKHYFRLWLSEMHLKRDREWFKTWYPVVHTLVRLQYAEQQAEISNVAGPMKINGIDLNNLENVVKLNYQMTTLMPFRGGTVEIMSGLLAMKGRDYLQAFLGTVEDFAELLVVPQLSMALSVAIPVASGIEKLLGATDGELHLGLHQTLQAKAGGGNVLAPGYFAVIRCEEDKLDKSKLWVVDDRLRYGDYMESSKLFKDYDHIVFRLEKQSERDDWDSLSSIAKPRDEMRKALIQGDCEEADGYRIAANIAALLCPDLTDVHKASVIKLIDQEFSELAPVDILSRVPKRAPRVSLSQAMKNAPVVDEKVLVLPSIGEIAGNAGKYAGHP